MNANEGRERPNLFKPPLGGNCTQALAAQLLDSTEKTHKLTGVMGDLTKVLDRMTPVVIGVQTVVLDSVGCATVSYRLPYQSLFVDSASAQLLTVANSPLQTGAPNAGPGVAFVRPGGNAVINFRAYQWSVYGGLPGDKVTVTAFAHPHAAHASSSTTAAQAATTTSIAATAASEVLFNAEPQANGRMVFNDSTATLYLAFGPTASETAYTTQVAPGGLYEFPIPMYAGVVSGIWSAANGSARLTSW
jgi:hypothetical protein